MSPWAAFKKGSARVWLHKRLVLWLYLINLVFAAVLVFPFRNIVGKIGKTDLADDFVAGFQVDSFTDFWSHYSLQLKSLGYSAVGLGALYLIVNVFLAGGIVATLAAEHRVSLRRFLNSASRYFVRYLRLLIFLVVVIGLAAVGYKTWVKPFVEDLREDATTDVASFLWRVLSAVFILMLASLILMVFDYAKIRTVVDARRSMILAAASAFAFSFRRFWRTVRLFYLNLGFVSVLFILYLLVENQFSNATKASTWGLFAVQQIFILSRIWMKLSFFSTQLVFYQSVSRPQPSPRPAETEPLPVPSSDTGPVTSLGSPLEAGTAGQLQNPQ